jgi:predicted anti-sigma-YlaC factor YlaD
MSTETCERDAARLSAYLDGEALDPAAVERHLASCAACRQELDELRAVQRVLQVPAVAADPYFVLRFRARHEASVRTLESWRRIAVRLLLPATATAAILAAVTVSRGEGDRDSFWELERHALGAGSPRVGSAPRSSELEPLFAAALGPREPVKPRVAGGDSER